MCGPLRPSRLFRVSPASPAPQRPGAGPRGSPSSHPTSCSSPPEALREPGFVFVFQVAPSPSSNPLCQVPTGNLFSLLSQGVSARRPDEGSTPAPGPGLRRAAGDGEGRPAPVVTSGARPGRGRAGVGAGGAGRRTRAGAGVGGTGASGRWPDPGARGCRDGRGSGSGGGRVGAAAGGEGAEWRTRRGEEEPRAGSGATGRRRYAPARRPGAQGQGGSFN